MARQNYPHPSVIGLMGVKRLGERSGRRASVRGRRVAAAGWRSQARGLDLSNALGLSGSEDEDEVTLSLAVPVTLSRRSGMVSDGKDVLGSRGTAELGVEVGAVAPHAVHDDGKPAGERDGGLSGADLLGKPTRPELEGRCGLDPVEEGGCGFEEQAADHGVAAFADPAAVLGFS